MTVIPFHIKNFTTWTWVVLMIIILVGLSGIGCATRHYKRTVVGELKGDLIVEWRKPNGFLYIPSMENPLRFKRLSNGEVIQPDRMWTDGGSIPRPFWVFKNYSPWGYGPAFIIHDWLFHMQDCELPGYEKFDIETAAMVMSEVMKTLMKDPDFDYGNKSSMYLMFKAVQTKPAQLAWEDKKCIAVDMKVEKSRPDAVFRFSF